MKLKLVFAAAATAAMLTACDGGPEAGMQAPTLSAVDTQGNEFSLASHKGEVVIMDFWAVW